MVINSIAKTCIRLLLKEPFYGHYMSGVPKEMTERVSTACVALFNNQLIKLQVNADFWEGLSDAHRYGLIKHEVLHIVLKHLLTCRDYSNKRLFNIAADIVVNQYIEPDQLPEGGITLKRFFYLENRHGIRIEPNKDVGYYYRILNGYLKSMSLEKSEEEKRNTKVNGDTKSEDDFFKSLLEEENQELERHKGWHEFEKLSPGDAKILKHHLDSSLKTTVSRVERSSNAFGTMPARLIEQLKAMIQAMKPQFDWRRMLRIFAASSNSTYIKNTLRRPSKRYGTTPGIKLKRRHKLLLAVDTSGSVPTKDLELFFSEIHHIWRQGAEITVVECDAAIQNTFKYRGRLSTTIHGRGGTNFSPPIDYANEELRPDAIIYFTDGYAPPPQNKSRYQILWVVTSNGVLKNSAGWVALPGQKIRMDA